MKISYLPNTEQLHKLHFSFLVILSSCFSINSLAQPIDYKNFDNKTAEKVLWEKIMYYRDTIQTFGGGVNIAEFYKDVPNYKSSYKWNWSDDVYKIFSRPNCDKISLGSKPYHVDVRDLVFSQKICEIFAPLIYNDFDKKFYTINSCGQFQYKGVEYSENAIKYTANFKTYQEMADKIIICWDNSVMHRGMMRRGHFYESTVLKNNKTVYPQAACAVSYKNGAFWATLNVVS